MKHKNDRRTVPQGAWQQQLANPTELDIIVKKFYTKKFCILEKQEAVHCILADRVSRDRSRNLATVAALKGHHKVS